MWTKLSRHLPYTSWRVKLWSAIALVLLTVAVNIAGPWVLHDLYQLLLLPGTMALGYGAGRLYGAAMKQYRREFLRDHGLEVQPCER